MIKPSRLGALAVLLSGLAASAVQAQTIELLHFWEKPAERAALQVLADSFEAEGGRWFGTSREDEISLKSYALERINSGFAPTAVQWHGGPEIARLFDLGISTTLEDVTGDEVARTLLPAVSQALDVRGATGALPVGMHSENWAWRNLEAYRATDLPAPRDWAHFLEQAPKLRAAGYRPLAVGRMGWERRSVFSTVLIDVGGPALYRRMIEARLDPVTDFELITQAVRLFQRLRDEATDPAYAHDNWHLSTLDVIEGRAAMQVMGDWAKGEFLSAGKVLGQDFDCVPAPGTSGRLIVLLDVFILPHTTSTDVRDAQRKLVEIVLDPENQLRFAKTKGALPVVSGLDTAGADSCTNMALATLERPEGSLASYSMVFGQDRTAELDGMIQTIWDSPELTAAEAATILMDECGADKLNRDQPEL